MTSEHYTEAVRTKLSSKRFIHSENVAARAVELAQIYNIDSEKAYIAGILHDIVKEDEHERQLNLLHDFGIMSSDINKISRKVLHSYAGEVYCRNVLGVEDEEILLAIKYHTTGRADMTMLEKIIYLADYTSADRKHSYSDVLQVIRSGDIDKALFIVARDTLELLVKNNMAVDINTIEMYNQLVKNRRK